MSRAPEPPPGNTGGAAEAPLTNVLLSIAADRTPQARGVLFRSLGEILLASGTPLSERERAEAGLILESLLREVETALRADLARRLALRHDVPRSLVLALARDEISVAEPVLASSPLLNDDELITLIRNRSQEHRLVIAARPGIAERVGDALVESGEELVLERLIRNADAQLSRKAIEYLVAESERVDRFREPLLRRADLPVDLAQRMYRWLSGALRQAIISRYQIDPQLLDDTMAEMVPPAQPPAVPPVAAPAMPAITAAAAQVAPPGPAATPAWPVAPPIAAPSAATTAATDALAAETTAASAPTARAPADAIPIATAAAAPGPVASAPATPRAVADDGSEEALALAHQIALRAATKGILNERYVLQNLRAGHVGLAAAALGELASVAPVQARRYMLDPGGEALALCCRAANLSAAATVSMIAMAAKAHDRPTTPPLGQDEITLLYERMTPPQARMALRLWRPAGAKPGNRVA